MPKNKPAAPKPAHKPLKPKPVTAPKSSAQAIDAKIISGQFDEALEKARIPWR